MSAEPYRPRRPARSVFVAARGLRQHLLEWGDAGMTSAERPTLVMLHGWMDVAASFQFVVDALRDDRHVLALDWRGFGASDTPAVDTYYFTEYLGDLELVLDALFGAGRGPIDLLGHSMGGNVAMLYSGVRPEQGPPPRQPRRLRHAALAAEHGAGADRQVARPAEDADAAQALPRPRRRRRAAAEDQSAAARRPRRVAGGELVAADRRATPAASAPSSPTPITSG